MINTSRPMRKGNIVAVAETKIVRPTAESKPCEQLEKNLSTYKIRFSADSGKLFIKRLIGMREMLSYVKSVSLYTAATIVTVMLLYGSIAAADIRMASEVLLSGKPMGVVDDAKHFEALVAETLSSLSATLGTEVPPVGKAVYIPRLALGKNMTEDEKLRQNILSTFDEVQQAYAVYVGDRLICATLKAEDAEAALSQIKDQYKEDGTDMTVSFVEDVAVRQEYVPLGYIKTHDGALAALTAKAEAGSDYTVTANDTLWGIAMKYNMSVEELMSLNSGVSETIHAGDVLAIKKSVPLLSVQVAYVFEGEKNIPFETTQTQDENMPSGNKKTVREGVEGKKYVVEEVVKVNGEVVATNVKSEKVLSEPVAAQVSVGTKKSLSTVASSGRLARPTYGTVTSRFGKRGRGFHSGLDIGAPTGTPIYAADGGTVTFAGWESGYGYLVKLDHGGGFVTYYGHCSALLTSVGKKVAKGDLIAKVGNTGNSTGPHLHFEVRKNGVAQDPSKYIN